MTYKKPANHEKTTLLSEDEVVHSWFVLDLAGKTLGRAASEIAKILRGKHKPTYNPAADCGDGVIVLNADKLVVTGNKQAQKNYYYYTGFSSGLRAVPYEVMLKRKPDYIITHAVKGMVPRTKLGRKVMKRLRVYKGAEHDMQAQKPIKVNI